MATAGSPGSSCWSPKMRIETKSSVGRIAPTRARRNRPIGVPPARLELQSLQPHQAIGHGLEARELPRVRPEPMAMEEVDDRLVGRFQLRDLLEHRRALLRVRRRALLADECIGIRTAPPRVVERLLAAEVAEEIAVRVGAAAPGEHVGLELALVRHVE